MSRLFLLFECGQYGPLPNEMGFQFLSAIIIDPYRHF